MTTPPPRANEPVIVYGGGAITAQYIVQLLAIAGYKRVIVAASTTHHPALHALGAWKCIDYRVGETAFAEAVLAVSNGEKVKLAVDVIAATPTLSALSKVIGEEGANIAVLMPVKEGNEITGDGVGKMHLEVPKWVEEMLPGVAIKPVYALKAQQVSFIVAYVLYFYS